MTDAKISILLVYDKKFMRDSIKQYILSNPVKKIGTVEYEFDITEVDNGEESILQYTSHNNVFEIVIMDLSMGKGINGLEASKQILEIDPNARIIGMASEGDRYVEEFKNCGIKFFLEKPFQSTYINSKIDSMIKEILLEKPVEELSLKKKKKSLMQKLMSK